MPAFIGTDQQSTPEQVAEARIRADRLQAEHLEQVALRRGSGAALALSRRVRNHAQSREDFLRRQRSMARLLPRGQVPAMLVSASRVGPWTRGGLSSGRPQARRPQTSRARAPAEPCDAEPGEPAAPADHDLLALASAALARLLASAGGSERMRAFNALPDDMRAKAWRRLRRRIEEERDA